MENFFSKRRILLILIILTWTIATYFIIENIFGVTEEEIIEAEFGKADFGKKIGAEAEPDYEKIKEAIKEKKEREMEMEEAILNNREKTSGTLIDLLPIEKNNESPQITFDDYEAYIGRYINFTNFKKACSLNYKVPESWIPTKRGEKDTDPRTGAYVQKNSYELSFYGEYDENQTTYEEVFNDFVEYKENYPYTECRTRNLEIDEDTNFTILETVHPKVITNYMVFVYAGQVISLEVVLPNVEKYDDNLLNTIDNIFRSAFIYY